MPRIRVSTGIELDYEEHGSGPPLLLNGGLGWRWVWYKNLPWLARHFRVIALDSRGLGDSDKPRGPYDVNTMATEAADVILALGLGRTHLMGLSLGCDIAVELALSYPWLAGALVLIGSRAGGAAQVYSPPAVLARMTPSPYLTPAANLTKSMPVAFSPGWLERHPSAAQMMGLMSAKKPTPDHARLALMWAGGTWQGLGLRGPELRTPVLLCHGTADQLMPVANAVRLAAMLPMARLALFPGAGHACQIEQPPAFNAIATQFLLDASYQARFLSAREL